MSIYLRKLKFEDAIISWKWRNDPEVWQLTGRKWNNYVSQQMEEDWIRKVAQEKDSVRFAICIEETDEYIGNVQLTDITNSDAIFHIFIGNKNYWGKGYGYKATDLILKYAKTDLKLEMIKLKVKHNNSAAIKVYTKVGFKALDCEGEYLTMIYKL